MKLTTQTVMLATLGVADLIFTLWLIQRGAAEANPLMAPVLRHSVGLFVVAKMALLLVPLGVLEWARRQKPQLGYRALNVALVAYILLYAIGVARANSVPMALETKPDPRATAVWNRWQTIHRCESENPPEQCQRIPKITNNSAA